MLFVVVTATYQTLFTLRSYLSTYLCNKAQHNCIRLLAERTGQPIKCFYRVGQDFLEATVQGSLMVTGADTARILAIQGVGITHLIEFVAQADLQTGRLQTILEGIEPPVRQAFALYKQRQHTALKVKYFLDFLAQAP